MLTVLGPGEDGQMKKPMETKHIFPDELRPSNKLFVFKSSFLFPYIQDKIETWQGG